MKKSSFIVLVLIFLTASCVTIIPPVKALEDSWVTKAPMPTAEASGGAVVVNGEIYVIGSGYTYVYNPSTDTWFSKTPMPTHQQSFGIAAIQNKIYVLGGFNSTDHYGIAVPNGASQMYDPAKDTWETKAPMLTPRKNLQANVVDGKIYLIGGDLYPMILGGNTSNANEAYDPLTDSWTEMAPISTPVYSYASAVVDNKVYVEGGENTEGFSNLNQIYNPETNTWSLGAPPPFPVAKAGAGATSGLFAPKRLYLIGGTANGNYGLNATQIYDPQANTWTFGASMPTARFGLAIAVVNDTLYALGGKPEAFTYLGTVAANEQYFPESYGEISLSPSPSLTPSPSLSPSPSQTIEPTLEPTQTATPSNDGNQTLDLTPILALSVIAVIAVVVGSLVYLKKRERS